MNNAIIFLSLIIIFLSIMLVITINVKFDLYGNYVCIQIKIYGIKILNIYISIIGLYIKINNSKKLKTLNIIFNKEQEYLILQMKKSIFDKLYFDKIKVDTNIGLGNASNSVLAIMTLNCVCEKIEYLNTLNKSECDIYYNNKANFVDDVVQLNTSIKVYFTIFDMIFAIILSFYKRGKYVKERQRKYKTKH